MGIASIIRQPVGGYCSSLALRLAASARQRARLMLPSGALSDVECSVTSMCDASQVAAGNSDAGTRVRRATV